MLKHGEGVCGGTKMMSCFSEDCLGEGSLPCMEMEPASSYFNLCFFDSSFEQEQVGTEEVGDRERGCLNSERCNKYSCFWNIGSLLGSWNCQDQSDGCAEQDSGTRTDMVDQLKKGGSELGTDLRQPTKPSPITQLLLGTPYQNESWA